MYRIDSRNKAYCFQKNSKLAQTLGALGITAKNAKDVPIELLENLGIDAELLRSIVDGEIRIIAPIPPHKSTKKRRRETPKKVEEILFNTEISRAVSKPPTPQQETRWNMLQVVGNASNTQGKIDEPSPTNPYDLVVQTASLIRASRRS